MSTRRRADDLDLHRDDRQTALTRRQADGRPPQQEDGLRRQDNGADDYDFVLRFRQLHLI